MNRSQPLSRRYRLYGLFFWFRAGNLRNFSFIRIALGTTLSFNETPMAAIIGQIDWAWLNAPKSNCRFANPPLEQLKKLDVPIIRSSGRTFGMNKRVAFSFFQFHILSCQFIVTFHRDISILQNCLLLNNNSFFVNQIGAEILYSFDDRFECYIKCHMISVSKIGKKIFDIYYWRW